jgi:hypothetical protein
MPNEIKNPNLPARPEIKKAAPFKPLHPDTANYLEEALLKRHLEKEDVKGFLERRAWYGNHSKG